jgi:hypothetical protein
MSRVFLIGLAMGGESEFDGQYLVEYDPSRDGVSPAGQPMNCHLVTTDDYAKAPNFTIHKIADMLTAVDPRDPVRPDGKPNRPITAYHMTFSG